MPNTYFLILKRCMYKCSNLYKVDGEIAKISTVISEFTHRIAMYCGVCHSKSKKLKTLGYLKSTSANSYKYTMNMIFMPSFFVYIVIRFIHTHRRSFADFSCNNTVVTKILICSTSASLTCGDLIQKTLMKNEHFKGYRGL